MHGWISLLYFSLIGSGIVPLAIISYQMESPLEKLGLKSIHTFASLINNPTTVWVRPVFTSNSTILAACHLSVPRPRIVE